MIDFGLWQSQKTAEVGIAGISGIAVYCRCHACQSGNPSIKHNYLKWEDLCAGIHRIEDTGKQVIAVDVFENK